MNTSADTGTAERSKNERMGTSRVRWNELGEVSRDFSQTSLAFAAPGPEVRFGKLPLRKNPRTLSPYSGDRKSA